MATMMKTKDRYNYYNLYMDGQWIESKSEQFFEVLNPADESVVAYVTSADESDVQLALESSTKAQKSWEALSPFERAEYIKVLMVKLEEKKEHFAKLLVMEQGKTYKEALVEVDDTIAYMAMAVAAAGRIKGDILAGPTGDKMLMIKKVPYGVTLGLCAWNYPLALVGRKLAPALVTGNTMIIKPHELTPLATIEFFKLVHEAGLPKGVVNLITGDGPQVGSQLVSSPLTKLISVTGSVKAGQAIYKAASQNIAGLCLELGGKAPFIVLEDADIDKAVEAAAIARYANCGQICICCDMIFVQESIREEFTAKLLEKVAQIKVGDPFDPTTDMGPKVSKGDLDKIDRIVKETVAQGGKILAGGAPLKGGIFDQGYWYEPTVLGDVTPDMTAAVDEIFGPVLPILSIKSLEEAIDLANASPYGLAAYLFTSDYSKFMKTSETLDVGTIFYNQGIAGYTHGYHSGHKLSGLGGEDGEYGIDWFLQKRSLYVAMD